MKQEETYLGTDSFIIIFKEKKSKVKKDLKPHRALAQIFIDDYAEVKHVVSGGEVDETKLIIKRELASSVNLSPMYYQKPNTKEALIRIYYFHKGAVITRDSLPKPSKAGNVNFVFRLNNQKSTLNTSFLSCCCNPKQKEMVIKRVTCAINKQLSKYGYSIELVDNEDEYDIEPMVFRMAYGFSLKQKK